MAITLLIQPKRVILSRRGITGPKGDKGDKGEKGDPGTGSVAIGDITGLQAALDAKASTSHTQAISTITGLQSALDGKSALVHSHTISDVTGLNTALAGKADAATTTTALAAKADSAAMTTALAAKADLVGGYILTSQMPRMLLTEFLGRVSSQSAMLALDAQKNDWCARTDVQMGFVLSTNDPTNVDNWVAIPHPTSPVMSVNGQIGVIVLGASDVGAQPNDGTLTALAGWNWSSGVEVPTFTAADTLSPLRVGSASNNLVQLTAAAKYPAIDGSLITLLNASAIASGTLDALRLPSGIDAAKIGGGSVSNTEFSYLDGVSSPIQTQFASKGSNIGNNGYYDSGPVVGTIPWLSKSQTAFTIVGVYGLKTSSGTVTFSIKINGVAVTGLSGITANSTAQDIAATGANNVAIGDRVTVEYTSVSSPVGLEFNLKDSQ